MNSRYASISNGSDTAVVSSTAGVYSPICLDTCLQRALNLEKIRRSSEVREKPGLNANGNAVPKKP